MPSVATHMIKEVTAHAQSDSLEDAREICAVDTYFPNNPPVYIQGVPGGKDLTSGECSLGQTIPI